MFTLEPSVPTNRGRIGLEEDVVVDGNLVTAPHYRNNGDFMKAVLKLMK